VGRVFSVALLLATFVTPLRAQDREDGGEVAASDETPASSEEDASPETVPADEEGPSAEAFASLQEGFGVRSRDGASELRVAGLLAVRGVVSKPPDEDASGEARVRLGRLAVQGHLADGLIRYFAQLEMAGGVQLLDLEVALALAPELQIRVGRIRTPFSRQFLVPLFAQQLPLRSVVSDYSRAGRDTGLTVEGRAFDGRFEYRVGAYDERLTDTPLIVGRLAVDPLGPLGYDETTARNPGDPRFSLGVNAFRGGRQREVRVADPTTGVVTSELAPETLRSAIGFDAAARVGPLGVSAEAFLGQRSAATGDEAKGAGAFVQAGVFVLPPHFEIVARYDWLTPDRDTSLRGLQRGEVGLNLYLLDAHLKVQASYVYTDVTDAVAAQVPAGSGHLVDLQVLLAL